MMLSKRICTLRQCRSYATPPRSPFTAAANTIRPATSPATIPPTQKPTVASSVPVVKPKWGASLGRPAEPAQRHPRDKTTWEAYKSLPYATKLKLIFSFTLFTALSVSLPAILGTVKDDEDGQWRGRGSIFGSIPRERDEIVRPRRAIVAEGKSEVVPS